MRWPWSKKGKASAASVVSPTVDAPRTQPHEPQYRSTQDSVQPLMTSVAEEPTMALSSPFTSFSFNSRRTWDPDSGISQAPGRTSIDLHLPSVPDTEPQVLVDRVVEATGKYPRHTVISGTVEAQSLAAPRALTEEDTSQYDGSVASDSDDENFRESSSEDASISHSRHLLQFLEGRWTKLMSRAKIVSGNLDHSHWTTGNVAGIGYQGIIDTGAYGDVFQVTRSYFALTLLDA
jgi:hypothetical protein